ncbi:hypothetical protein [Streptoalloteichus hindustanus]|uniref:hypothetical protein n=1 Tax=Streptoalloteichus hindustanus TaxID=2017 RepID=UPI0011613FB0|nr:hypothetical protein [Streptoalloteichus hindustanus]
MSGPFDGPLRQGDMMLVEIVSWLSLVSRSAVSVAARATTLGADGSVRTRSEHVLHADSLMRWSYTAQGSDHERYQFCDGAELFHSERGTSTSTPARPPAGCPDDTWPDCSWPAVVDAWLVEMVRPLDLLARVTISSISGDRLVRITAEPLSNQPSPYNGLSVPDGRTVAVVLDVDRGCLTEGTITRPGFDTVTFTLTRLW